MHNKNKLVASAEHLKLSSIIKDVHSQLRDDTLELGETFAWSQHLKRKQRLQIYAEAMESLATTFWNSNTAVRNSSKGNQGKEHNRIEWAVQFCLDYFGAAELVSLQYQRDRELRILSSMNTSLTQGVYDSWQGNLNGRLKLLDVGSCYNPFSQYDQFDVTAIDIAPANSDVIECDFLSATIDRDSTTTPRSAILHMASYDIVVFSLLLEYMPTSGQRMLCCRKAYELLRPEGVLIVITPDSKHEGANARLMKNWRYTLAGMGFSRIKIQKLDHITCMAFRKAISKEVAIRWAKLHHEEWMVEAINIPQDSKNQQVGLDSESETNSHNCSGNS